MVALDGEGRIVHANASAAALLGSKVGTLEGETLWDRIPEPGRGRFKKACQAALREGRRVEIEVPWRREDRWFRLEAFPIGGHISLHLHDVSGRNRLESTLRIRERALADACEIVKDPDRGPLERIKGLLTTVRATVGTQFATLSHVDPEDGAYRFDVVGVANEQDLPEGESIPLEELPICASVARDEETLVLHDVEAQAPHLVDPTWGISAYIGSPVHVGDEVYGTFCFYSTERRSGAFQDWEITYVELFSRVASAELYRLAAETADVEGPRMTRPA